MNRYSPFQQLSQGTNLMQYGMQTGMRPYYMNAPSPFYQGSGYGGIPMGGMGGMQMGGMPMGGGFNRQRLDNMAAGGEMNEALDYARASGLSDQSIATIAKNDYGIPLNEGLAYLTQHQTPAWRMQMGQNGNPASVYGGLFGTNPMFGSLPNPYQFGYGLRKTDGSWAGPYGQLPGVQKGQQQPEAPAAAEAAAVYSPWKNAPQSAGRAWGERVGDYVWGMPTNNPKLAEWDGSTTYDETQFGVGSGAYNRYVAGGFASPGENFNKGDFVGTGRVQRGDDLSEGAWMYINPNQAFRY